MILVKFIALILSLGAVVPRISLQDHLGNWRSFPENRPALFIYEDQEGRRQNTALKQQLGKLNSSPENQTKVDVVPIANVEKWNWWPAKQHALAGVQKAAAADRTTVYLDWTGQIRKQFGFAPHQGCFVLLDGTGKIRFISEGPLSQQQEATLMSQLADFGFGISLR